MRLTRAKMKSREGIMTQTSSGEQLSFNPNDHLMQIKNRGGSADYLPVQWRLVWFRLACPQGTIDTEELEYDPDREFEVETYQWNNDTRRSEKVVKKAKGFARFRAVVTDGKGGRATGHKSERAVDFPDYYEKAETGAIGRALAALGYGTQFAPELDEQHRIVDAPVDRQPVTAEPPKVPAAPVSAATNGRPAANQHAEDAPATEQQLSSLRKLCQHLGKPELEQPEALTYLAAKELITKLSHEYNERRAQRKNVS
jgi:hypothetical protein